MTNLEKAKSAADHLNSTWDGEKCVYYDESTQEYYICDDESEMVDLYDLIHYADGDDKTEEDQDIARDAYSHWCAGTSHLVVDEDGNPF